MIHQKKVSPQGAAKHRARYLGASICDIHVSGAVLKFKMNVVKVLLVNAALSGAEVLARPKGFALAPGLQAMQRFITQKCRAILSGTATFSAELGHLVAGAAGRDSAQV
eukprot:1655162-Pyramimonas_sp.AAC.1